MIMLWVLKRDGKLLKQTCGVSLERYGEEYFRGVLENDGVLARARKQFVLGKQQGNYSVRIDNSTLYREGLILTEDRLDRPQTKAKKVRLMGSHDDDTVYRAFKTFYESPLFNRLEGSRDEHFLLYRSEPTVAKDSSESSLMPSS